MDHSSDPPPSAPHYTGHGQTPQTPSSIASQTPTSDLAIQTAQGRSQYSMHADYMRFPAGSVPVAAPMAQQPHHPQMNDNNSPSYASHPAPPYSPFSSQHEMPSYPAHQVPPPAHPGAAMYTPRNDWSAGPAVPPYTVPHHMPYVSAGSTPTTPTVVSPGQRIGMGGPPHPGNGYPAMAANHTVYSFVPIPGAAQQKRPRRRYEEIERMYKCGWEGCEKAYGTLNHLNAHVTMQAHGPKRTPDEFRSIRQEWKARKKEEEARRKAMEAQPASAPNF